MQTKSAPYQYFKAVFKRAKKGFESKSRCAQLLFSKKALMRFLQSENREDSEGLFFESSLALHHELCESISYDLIDNKGQFSDEKLRDWSQFLGSFCSIVGPGYNFSLPRIDQIRFSLQELKDRDLVKHLQRFSVPTGQTLGFKLLKKVPSLSRKQKLTLADVRRSILAAFLAEIRQSIGSCFATAAGQYIREKDPVRFFKDVESLLYKGGLERVFEGRELKAPALLYTSKGQLHTKASRCQNRRLISFLIYDIFERIDTKEPISLWSIWHFVKKGGATETSLFEELAQFFQSHFAIPALIFKDKFSAPQSTYEPAWLKLQEMWEAALNIGAGYSENPILKAWEYSLASFSDVKLDFAYWNSFLALGLDPKEPLGLSAYLHSELEKRIAEFGKQIEDIQKDMQTSGGYIQSLQMRARSATSESELARLQSSARGQESRYYRLRAEMQDLSRRTHALTSVLPHLIKTIQEKFQEYFQEVYDPTLAQNEQGRLRDDRIAGFCLAVKRGLKDPSLWTLVKTEEAYTIHLSQFFQSYFSEMTLFPEMEQIHAKDLSFITSVIQRFISSNDFLDGAQKRVRSHRQGAMDLSYFTPWSYLSGGSLEQVLEVYFEKKGLFDEVEKTSSSMEELLAFYIEAAYELSLNNQELCRKFPLVGSRFLMSAPEHSCLFQPGAKSFLESWSKEQFPYTWIRDCFTLPSIASLNSFKFDPFSSSAFLEILKMKSGNSFGGLVEDLDFSGLSLEASSQLLLKRIIGPMRVQALALFDACAYTYLPFTQGQHVRQTAFELLCALVPENRYQCEEALRQSAFLKDIPKHALFSKLDVYAFVKMLYIKSTDTIGCPFAFEERLEHLASQMGYSLSKGLRFADSNWTKDYLSFVVNPRSLSLEIWRTDYSLSIGSPMETWNTSVNNERGRFSIFKTAIH